MVQDVLIQLLHVQHIQVPKLHVKHLLEIRSLVQIHQLQLQLLLVLIKIVLVWVQHQVKLIVKVMENIVIIMVLVVVLFKHVLHYQEILWHVLLILHRMGHVKELPYLQLHHQVVQLLHVQMPQSHWILMIYVMLGKLDVKLMVLDVWQWPLVVIYKVKVHVLLM